MNALKYIDLVLNLLINVTMLEIISHHSCCHGITIF